MTVSLMNIYFLSMTDHEVMVGLARLHCGTIVVMRGQHVTGVSGVVLSRMESIIFYFSRLRYL